MAPAAFNRQTDPRAATDVFMIIATRLLLWSMLLLAVGICLDFYLIAKVILGGGPSGLLATGLFAVFATLWFVLLRAQSAQRLILGRK